MAKKRSRSKLKEFVRNFNKQPRHKAYLTTPRECKRWFNIINKEIFNSKLPTVTSWDIRWRRTAWAWYTFDDDIKKKTGKVVCEMQMNKRYHSKKFFIEVLAHEMIHHWQAANDAPFGHGDSFKQWKSDFARKGIKITERF